MHKIIKSPECKINATRQPSEKGRKPVKHGGVPKLASQRIKITLLEGTTKKGLLVHGVTYIDGVPHREI